MLISQALEGKYIKSSQGEGIIQFADFRKDMRHSTPDGYFAYAVNVRPHWNGTGFPKPDFYTTIYVGIDE